MRARQLTLPMPTPAPTAARNHGGARAGAGRPRIHPRLDPKRREQPHLARTRLAGRHPVHVVVRVVRELHGLRRRARYRAIRAALATQLRRDDFRICHLSIQGTHLHLIVEANDQHALGRGMRGFCVATARRLNALVCRRGRAFTDRYHATQLQTPAQVRHAIGYVLNNWRKHGDDKRVRGAEIDPYSSVRSFAPWVGTLAARGDWPIEYAEAALPVATPVTWLLGVGWQRSGDVLWRTVPGGSGKRGARGAGLWA